MDYNKIHSTSLLKWYVRPNKKKYHKTTKKKKKTMKKEQSNDDELSNIYSAVYPCYICPNIEEAIAGHEDYIKTPKSNHCTLQHNDNNNNNNNDTTVIRFIGYRVSYSDQIQSVSSKFLLPYNIKNSSNSSSNNTNTINHHSDKNQHTDDGIISNNKQQPLSSSLSSSASSTNITNTNATSATTSIHHECDDIKETTATSTITTNCTTATTTPPSQWNTTLMRQYMKLLRASQQEFKHDLKKLQVEEMLLHIIATSVHENEQNEQFKHQEMIRNAVAKKNEDDNDHDNTCIDDENDDDQEKDNTTTTMIVPKTTLTTLTNDTTAAISRPVTTVHKLRAGDVIEYWYVLQCYIFLQYIFRVPPTTFSLYCVLKN
jgi:hypothetical protein